jgi:hypothetical protein
MRLLRMQRQTQKVVLHGGLGNQLFQWSYGHHLTLSGFKVEYIFYKRSYLVEHTKKSLGDFLGSCTHGTFKEVKLPSIPILRVLSDPVHKKNLLSAALSQVADTTNNPFVYPPASLGYKRNIHFGQFQASNSVLSVKELVLNELWDTLDARVRSSLEVKLDGAEVIHVRGGDFFSPSIVKSIGVLSPQYYKQLPPKGNNLRVVLTNDIDVAKEIFQSSEIDGIFGPTDLDVYQTLAVMARATSLYTANSTFSWWGGLLAQSRHAKVYIPEPFFRDFLPNPNAAFSYPGFKTIRANFLED